MTTQLQSGVVPPLLEHLAYFGVNLSQRQWEKDGQVFVDGETADYCGSIALEAFATFIGRSVKVEGFSQHHRGKTFAPALAAATQRAKTAQQAECEASQSGPKGNAQSKSGETPHV